MASKRRFVFYQKKQETSEVVGRKKKIMIREFRSCPNVNGGMRILSTSVDMTTGGTTVVNAQFELIEDIKGVNNVLVDVHKCPSYAEIDKCEFFMRMPMRRNYCANIADPNQFYSRVNKAIHPPITKCPFKKGIYRLVNVTMDVDKIEEFVVDMPIIYTHYWTFQFRLYYDKYFIFCGIGGGEIVTIRSRE
ncbi:hypothetical protein AAG570_002223 [Ranatra chinensis]|uniref:Uncharacterized protein n=1 Tax=Ranatra chinensis TaxID=642074 RepID=A0ABD0Y6X0_9HEMI